MCKLCETNPVYEFTNKRKLCKRCFVNYFVKKFLYTVRKFNMAHQGDIIGYKKGNKLKEVVLEDLLEFFSKKSGIKIVTLPNTKANKIAVDSSIDSESTEIIETLIKGNSSSFEKQLPTENKIIKPLYLFLDEEILLYAKIKNLKFKGGEPSAGSSQFMHPRRKLKINKKDNIQEFVDQFEKKHPEVKRAIVNSLLELYK